MGKADIEAINKRIQAGEEKERKEHIKKMKKNLKKKKEGFFKDFKKFITKGNVVDMAVGVIVGGAFTAIVNALSNQILKPLINWVLAKVLGKDSLSEVYTFLTRVNAADGTPDLEQSIYIDWGAFINAIINFLLVAFTLFVIARIASHVLKRIKARELEAAAAAAEKQKAADAEKAAAAAAAAAEKEAQLQQFYAHIARQTELIEQIAKK